MGLKSILKYLISGKKSDDNKSIHNFGECFYLLIKDLDKPFLRSYLISTLLGKTDSDRLLIAENHPAYGCLKECNYNAIKKMFFYLLNKRCFSVTKINKRYLFSTSEEQLMLLHNIDYDGYDSYDIPTDENEFFDSFVIEDKLEENIGVKSSEKIKSRSIDTTLTPEEQKIYYVLSQIRKQLAKELNVPAYVIFYNRTLENIAKIKPNNDSEFLKVPGVSKEKHEKYGKYFLDGILELKKESLIDSTENMNIKTCENNKFVSKSESLSKYNRINIPENTDELEDKRIKSNDEFVKNALTIEKKYLDDILKEIDNNIKLDIKQREAVLRDEDYTLIVAGAGSGKTTTVAAKVKYLVERKNVNPQEILIVSYTNDAVNELKDRINKTLGIPAVISTFHKVGYAIVRKQKDAEKMQIAHEGIIFNVIRDYLKSLLQNRPDDLKSMILFFGYYIDAPIGADSLDGIINHFQRNDYTTLKENLVEITENIITEKAKKRLSIKQEIMRSLEEVQIANFLYLHDIDYSYEQVYPFHIKDSKKLYTPDFTIRYKDKTIYLEHFGISESGLNNRYSEEQLETYKNHINTKISLHKEKGTKLIYTFSQYNDGKALVEHLEELLIKEDIKLVEKPVQEVYKKIIDDEENKYFTKLIFLIKDFISSFKINGYSETSFSELENRTSNVRNKIFLKIVKPIYLHYQSFLLENDMIDFEDMINESSRILSTQDIKELIPNFRYVIVDEYQDISMQRFDLTKALSKLTNAKIIAVGDDWQSIFAFAGSRVDLFLKFKDLFGYADYLTIDHTYRNAQQLIDSAGKFIQENNKQLKKNLKSPKNIEFPIILYEYNDIVYKNEVKGYKGILYEKAKLCDEIFKELFEEYGPNQTIALLGRYNFELERLATTEFFDSDGRGNIKAVNYPKIKLKFMTIHASKGLGFDNVIILNGSDEVFGFPSQIEMDPILRLVKYDDKTIAYAEERRLFYVALTRTKNKVYLLYPKTRPSEFVKELTKGYSQVRYPKNINQSVPLQDRKDKRCPLCGYPLQFKHNKAYGLKLYMCTNEPELCGYLTNSLRSGTKSVSKCPDCKTGFLIVKNSKKNDKYFFGCTNYKENGKGCNHIEQI